MSLWGLVLAVEMVGRAPSVSGVTKALLVTVILLVLVSAVAVPVAGGTLVLFAIRQDLSRPGHRGQALLAALLGLTLIVLGFRWLPWAIDPIGPPPGMNAVGVS